MSNLQNKVCAFNVVGKERVMNITPILFRVHENDDKKLDDIIDEHIDGFLNFVYDNAKTVDDLTNIIIKGIVYDVVSDTDLFETYDKDITGLIDFNNSVVIGLVTDKINEYANLVLKKIDVPVVCESFVDAYETIKKNNDNKINHETFIQYILRCFYDEYNNNNMLEKCAQNILTNTFKTN